MNLIEKRKSQLKSIGALILAVSVIVTVIGIVLALTCKVTENLSIARLVVGIVLIVIGIAGMILGFYLSWVAAAVQATQGSIAEDNLGKGTVNMHKCENCGAEVEEGKKICAKCEENLKP